jgi:hypothetical protein
VFLTLDASSATAMSPQALLAALPRRKQLFEAIGSHGLELADISEMPLDERHTLVRTSWNLRMPDEPPRDPVRLRSTSILRKDDGGWRIVFYLNHQDMNKLFTELAATGPRPGDVPGLRPAAGPGTRLSPGRRERAWLVPFGARRC